MSKLYPVPQEKQVLEILLMLYGSDVTLGSGQPVPMENGSSLLAVYINDEGKPSTACVCNYNFAAFAGSALTRIPVGGAEDAAETGDFSDMMLSNLSEVMNICSRMFMTDASPHIKLDVVYKTIDDAPDDVKALFSATEDRSDFDVGIPNYGSGAISFLCT